MERGPKKEFQMRQYSLRHQDPRQVGASFANLPIEMKWLILSSADLGLETLKAVRLVCREWKDIMDDVGRRRFRFKNYILSDKTLKYFRRVCRLEFNAVTVKDLHEHLFLPELNACQLKVKILHIILCNLDPSNLFQLLYLSQQSVEQIRIDLNASASALNHCNQKVSNEELNHRLACIQLPMLNQLTIYDRWIDINTYPCTNASCHLHLPNHKISLNRNVNISTYPSPNWSLSHRNSTHYLQNPNWNLNPNSFPYQNQSNYSTNTLHSMETTIDICDGNHAQFLANTFDRRCEFMHSLTHMKMPCIEHFIWYVDIRDFDRSTLDHLAPLFHQVFLLVKKNHESIRHVHIDLVRSLYKYIRIDVRPGQMDDSLRSAINSEQLACSLKKQVLETYAVVVATVQEFIWVYPRGRQSQSYVRLKEHPLSNMARFLQELVNKIIKAGYGQVMYKRPQNSH